MQQRSVVILADRTINVYRGLLKQSKTNNKQTNTETANQRKSEPSATDDSQAAKATPSSAKT